MKIEKIEISTSLRDELQNFIHSCTCPAKIQFGDLFSIEINEKNSLREFYSKESGSKTPNSWKDSNTNCADEFSGLEDQLKAKFQSCDVVTIPKVGVVFSDRATEQKNPNYYFFADPSLEKSTGAQFVPTFPPNSDQNMLGGVLEKSFH